MSQVNQHSIDGSISTTHSADILNSVCPILRQYDISPTSIDLCIPDALLRCHVETLSQFFRIWRQVHSTTVCYFCIFRAPEKVLPCGHYLCDRCIQLSGDQNCPATFSFRITYCPLRQEPFNDTRIILEPPSAGTRILSLDGGGCRGVILLETLQVISQSLKQFGIHQNIYKNFDLCFGTSAGKPLDGYPRYHGLTIQVQVH